MTTTCLDPSPKSATQPSLSVQPLLAEIQRRGGLMALFPTEEVAYGNGMRGSGHEWERMPRAVEDLKRTTVQPSARSAFLRVQRALHRAGQAGHISLRLADDICCRLLGVHPSAIWEGEYWSLPDD